MWGGIGSGDKKWVMVCVCGEREGLGVGLGGRRVVGGGRIKFGLRVK